MKNFKNPQTTFHLPVGYKHLLFGIDKEHIIAKAETNISEFSSELRIIPAIKPFKFGILTRALTS